MIEWKGLFANTPYSPANNKTQDDAVVGMQDTIYVTGPGYGGYSANVRVHNESGAVVALIPVSGGGGALSAPAPVRILDDSTTYSYSLEVVRGAIPSGDADKIIIRIVGGAAKRFPGAGVNPSPDGSTLVSTDPIVATRVKSVINAAGIYGPYRISTPPGLGSIIGASTRTIQYAALVPKSIGMAFAFHNWGAAAINIVSAKFAWAPTWGNDGAGLAWSSLTFAEAGTQQIPACINPVDSTYKAMQPGVIVCDPILTPSIARTDDPTSPYAVAMVRIETDADWYGQNMERGVHYKYGEATGFKISLGYTANTGVSDATAIGQGYSATSYFWSFGDFLPILQKPDICLAAHGDSLLYAGQNNATTPYCYLSSVALAAKAEGRHICVANYGIGGSSKKRCHYPRFLREIVAQPRMRPSHYYQAPYSVNEVGDLTVDCQIGLFYTALIVKKCRELGITPIVGTPFPNSGITTAAHKAAFDALLAYVLGLEEQGIAIVPRVGEVVADPADRYHFASTVTTDGTHINDPVANAAIGQVIWEAIR